MPRSDDPLVYGLFCESSHGYHKWVWIRRLPKTIKQARQFIEDPFSRFTYSGPRPRRSEPVPLSWFNKHYREQTDLGYIVHPIYPMDLFRYTPRAIRRRNATK
jgi:hypothetical protein